MKYDSDDRYNIPLVNKKGLSVMKDENHFRVRDYARVCRVGH